MKMFRLSELYRKKTLSLLERTGNWNALSSGFGGSSTRYWGLSFR